MAKVDNRFAILDEGNVLSKQLILRIFVNTFAETVKLQCV